MYRSTPCVASAFFSAGASYLCTFGQAVEGVCA